jgi:hypothetical protein
LQLANLLETKIDEHYNRKVVAVEIDKISGRIKAAIPSSFSDSTTQDEL